MPMTSRAQQPSLVPKNRRHPHSPQRRQRAAGRSRWARLSNRSRAHTSGWNHRHGRDLGRHAALLCPNGPAKPLGRALPLPAVEPPPKAWCRPVCPLAPAPQPRPKPAQPPLHPAPHAPVHPPVRLRYAGAVIAGSHLAPTRPENTINTELGLARYMPLAYGALRFSFRVSHEYHRFLDPSSALCQGISCQTSASSPVPIMSDHHTPGDLLCQFL